MSTTEHCCNHTQTQATYACFVCKSPICEDCVCTRDDGAIVCPNCAAPEPLEEATAEALPSAGIPPTAPPATPAADSYELADSPAAVQFTTTSASLGPCKNHPEAAAVAQCAQCRVLICATCDFPFGPVHLCPACATNPKQGLTPKRKAMAYWSIGLGVGNVLMTIGLFILAAMLAGKLDKEAVQLVGCCVILCILGSAVGFVLGLSSFNKRSHNPGYLWIGPIVNGLIGAMWIFRIVINML